MPRPATWRVRPPKRRSRPWCWQPGSPPPYSHSLEKLVELLQQQGLDLPGLAELHLKALTRMNSASRYPQGDEAPADLFDANDSTTALGTAEAVVRIAMAQLQA